MVWIHRSANSGELRFQESCLVFGRVPRENKNIAFYHDGADMGDQCTGCFDCLFMSYFKSLVVLLSQDDLKILPRCLSKCLK